MRKWLVFLCVLLITLSLILSVIDIVIESEKKKEKIIKQEEKEEKQIIEYKANQTIRVRMCKTNEVVAMDINDYLRGVVPSEMPPSYNMEALKAQAIVARTFMYKKMLEKPKDSDADVSDDFNTCQAFYQKDKLFDIWSNRGFNDETKTNYWDRVNEAVVSTQNQVILYNGELIRAYFHASSPERTESVDQIWGGVEIPYLVSVENSEISTYKNRNSEVLVTFSDLEKNICNNIDNNFKVLDDSNLSDSIKINSYTTSGRVKDVKIFNLIVSAEKLRVMFGIKSTNFKICILEDGILFEVVGYGHGIGMSQVGANYLAQNGMSCEEIIKYYYTGVEVITL